MKHTAEYERFTRLVDHVLSVPSRFIKQRMEEYHKGAAEKPNRRGPKRKATKPSADREVNGQG